MQHLSYDMVQKRDTGTPRTVARIHCADCTAKAEYTITGSHAPDKVVKYFRQHGWQADKYAPRLNRCPACLAASKREKHDPEAELKRITLERVRDHMAKAATIIPPAQGSMMGSIVMSNGHDHDPEPMAVPHPVATHAPTKPNKEQLARIRAVLDLHYDDARGYYLNGLTDQKIADDLGLPRAMVATVREAAYGPLLGNPETEELRAEVTAIQKQITEAHKIAGEAQTRIDKLLARIGEIERAVGAR